MFYVGQMVVCIGTDVTGGPPPHPTKGCIYTISGFCLKDHESGNVGVYLEEIPDHTDDLAGGWCSCFRKHDFRPVKTTNIEIFKKLVEPVA